MLKIHLILVKQKLLKLEYDFDIASSDLPTEEQTMNLTFDMNYVQA